MRRMWNCGWCWANGSDETCDSPEPDVYLEIGEGATISGQAVKGYVSGQERHKSGSVAWSGVSRRG